MSSFTDQIRTFNPYIKQLPVEAYSQVEMMKQQQYNQGVQSIQATLDSVAGMPVDSKYTPYVQSALSKLNEGIKKVAGSDFSNMQLVNQIEGSAKTIAADPIVQNGVISAQVDKQNRSIMLEDRKNGKLTPDNEYDYLEEYNKWKNDPDLSKPFNYSYSTNIDINKKWLDVLKAINPNADTRDIPFETDQFGNIDYNKIATVMTEKGYKGVSPEQLETALRASLSEADYNQLRISAKYRFRGYGAPELQKLTEQKYQQTKQELLDRKAKIEEQIKLYPETTENGKALKESLNYINDQLGSTNSKGKLDIQRESELAWVASNPEQAKTELYKNGYITQFAHAFSYMDQSIKYLESPYTKYQNWLMDYNLKVQDNQLAADKFAYQKTQDLFENSIKFRTLQLEEQKAGLGATNVFTTDLGVDTKNVTVKTATQTTADLATNYFNQANALTENLIDDLTKAGQNRDEVRKQVQTMITQYQNGTLDHTYDEFKDQIKDIIKANSNAANITAFLKDAEKEAEVNLQKSPAYQQLQANIASRNKLRIGDQVFTPQEGLDYLAKESVDEVSGSITIDPNKLTKKERALYMILKDTRYNTFGGNPTPQPNQALAAKWLTDFGDIFNANSAIINAKNTAVEDYLQKRTPTFIPTATTINLSKPEIQKGVFGKISTILVSRIERGAGGNEGLDIEKAKAMIDLDTKSNKAADTKVDLISQPGNYQLVLSNGSERQVIHISDSEANQLLPQLANQNSDLAIRLAMGRTTTNYLGTPEGALYHRTDFPSVQKLNVTADLKPIKGSSDAAGNPLFYIEYNTQINGKWTKLQLQTPLTIDQVKENTQGVTDEMLLAAYKQAGLAQ